MNPHMRGAGATIPVAQRRPSGCGMLELEAEAQKSARFLEIGGHGDHAVFPNAFSRGRH